MFSNSIILIFAIFSNCYWYCLTTNDTIDYALFWHFVKKLNSWIIKNKNFGHDEVFWIMDNCPSHKSVKTKNELIRTNLSIRYIPAYFPDLAHVELSFAFIKMKLIKLWKSRKANLKKKDFQNELLLILNAMNLHQIRRFY